MLLIGGSATIQTHMWTDAKGNAVYERYRAKQKLH